MHPKDADGMANSVDPVRLLLSGSTLFAQEKSVWVYSICSDLTVRKLSIITVTNILPPVFAHYILSNILENSEEA